MEFDTTENPDIPNQYCWDYFNANYWNVIAMSQDEFVNRNWTSIRKLGPTLSGDNIVFGIYGNDGCLGYYDVGRQAGCLSPGM
jgi:hypothetical protein